MRPGRPCHGFYATSCPGCQLIHVARRTQDGLDLDKDNANAMLAQDIERLARLQERLYAYDRWALLVVLQGMDAAGKDGAIKHVMSGINPQGCEVYPFKPPKS